MKKLKIASGGADNSPVNVDVFGDGAAAVPRPAWQVIEAARRQFLTGELALPTEPPTNVYLRDGDVYFAERTTDGGLGIRLLVEGVITRAQLQKGTLLVSGTEHLGRLFERDTTIEREPIELCVELMTDDVLVAIAEEVVSDYTLTLYRRHASGIDRWLPRKVEVISRLVERPEHADPSDELVALAAPAPVPGKAALTSRPSPPLTPVVIPAAPAAPVPHVADPSPGDAVEPVLPVVSLPEVAAPAPSAPSPIPALAPVEIGPVATPVFETHAVCETAPSNLLGPALAAVPPAHSPVLAPLPLVSPASLLETTAPLTPAALLDAGPADDDGISLAHSAVEAIMSTAIAEEVAEAVRRALQAIDAVAAPVTAMSPADVVSGLYSPEPSVGN